MRRTYTVYSFATAVLCSLVLVSFNSSAVAQSVLSNVSPAIPSAISQGTVTAGTVCPKCGKIHASGPSSVSPVTSATTSAVAPVSYSAPVQNVSAQRPSQGPAPRIVQQPSPISYASPQPTSGGSQNVLAMLNGQRSRQGLRSLRYDGALQAVAARRAQQMASMGIKSHPPGSFAPGRYEGVGWSSSFSPNGVYACYTSDPNMTAAGAAMVRGRDGVYFAVVYR